MRVTNGIRTPNKKCESEYCMFKIIKNLKGMNFQTKVL